MDPKKIAIIKNQKPFINVKKMQSFLKLANYYRKFIARFGRIALLLTNLIKKKQQFKKKKKKQNAFNQLKNVIISEPIFIIYDLKRPVKLETDALDYAFKV